MTSNDRRAVRLALYCDSTGEVGGAEASAATLVASLGEHVEVLVLGIDPAVLRTIAGKRRHATTRLLPKIYGYRDVRGMVALARVLRAYRAHIFQANLTSPWYGQYALAVAALVPGIRPVAVIHLPTPPPSPRARWLAHQMWGRLAARVAVGRRSAHEIEELVQVRHGSMRVIHNGVQVETGAERAAQDRDGFTIGSVGRLHTQKGYDVLIRAMANLPDAARAVLVGDGPERLRLEALAAELGIADRVTFTGWREDARTCLHSFDVFVLPSRFEAFPVTILEAMAVPLPVVATAVGSVAEAIEDDVTGILVPAEDVQALTSALERLSGDPDVRGRLAAAAQDRVRERFTAAAMAARYEALYDELMG